MVVLKKTQWAVERASCSLLCSNRWPMRPGWLGVFKGGALSVTACATPDRGVQPVLAAVALILFLQVREGLGAEKVGLRSTGGAAPAAVSVVAVAVP